MEKLKVFIAEQDSEDKDAMLEFAKQWDVLDSPRSVSMATTCLNSSSCIPFRISKFRKRPSVSPLGT